MSEWPEIEIRGSGSIDYNVFGFWSLAFFVFAFQDGRWEVAV